MSTYLTTLSADFTHGDGSELPDTDVRIVEDGLYVEDDMGSRIDIKTIYSDTLLGIRRAVRELNIGSIPIYTPYDCSGMLCYHGCKLLKVYRTYVGSFVAVVEIRKTYDV